MILRSTLFRKVTIVGVGLMGGSVGMALRKNKIAKEVVGLSQKQSSIVTAMKHHAIDQGMTDIGKAVRNADLIIFAAPVESIIKLFSAIAPHVKRGTILTDLGSSKVSITEAAQKLLPNPQFFIGSHPLVGSEKQGVENARAQLFEGAKCIMTPREDSNHGAVKKIKKMWEQLGSTVMTLDPHEHDAVLSNISHLPHILAFSLMHTIPQDHLKHAPQSLKDLTRIAASSPQLWNDICISNAANVVKAIDKIVEELAVVRKSIAQKDQIRLVEYFKKAQENRSALE